MVWGINSHRENMPFASTKFLLVFSIERGANIFLAMHNPFVLPWLILRLNFGEGHKFAVTIKWLVWTRVDTAAACLLLFLKCPALYIFPPRKKEGCTPALGYGDVQDLCCLHSLLWGHHEQLRSNKRQFLGKLYKAFWQLFLFSWLILTLFSSCCIKFGN